MLVFKYINKYWTLYVNGAPLISFATLADAVIAVPEADVELV